MNIAEMTLEKQIMPNTDLDKCVRVFYRANKKNKRTYIDGLELFVDKNTINEFCFKMKKALGAGCIMENDEETGKLCFGFQGNHVSKIKQLLVTEMNIDPKRIV